MGINKFNCEGYYDPTPYEALTRIENWRRASSTHSGPLFTSALRSPGMWRATRKRRRATAGLRWTPGISPSRPTCTFPGLWMTPTPGSGIWLCSWTSSCSPNAPSCGCSGTTVSKGMGIEIEKAKRKGQTIRYFTENCQEVSV